MMEHYWHFVQHGFWFKRAYEQLFASLPRDRPSTWVEVGVFHGGSLAWLGVEAINNAVPVTIHAVDNFVGYASTAHGIELKRSFLRTMGPIAEALGERFQLHEMASVDGAREIADRSCDVVWIDADHSYEAVKQDIAAWWPKVKVGGTLGGDDYTYDRAEVRQAVLEAFPESDVIVEDGICGDQPWPYWMVRKHAPNA